MTRELILKSIEAHGGLARWNQIEAVTATFHPDGLALQMRSQQAFSRQPTRVTVDTRRQKAIFDPFLKSDHLGIYEPHRTAIETRGGAVVEELLNPRDSFSAEVPWSGPQMIYFAGHALWTYFNLPFRLAGDDFRLQELEPWIEDGETWRAVKVIFPSEIATLCSEQVLYFDERGMIRREDYSVEVSQNTPVAHYVDGHQSFDGIVFPTRRRIYPRGPDLRPNRDVVIMAADLSDFRTVTVDSGSEGHWVVETCD